MRGNQSGVILRRPAILARVRLHGVQGSSCRCTAEEFAVITEEVQHWSLTTLREKLTKIGAKVVRHAKYVTFQMAEVAVLRELFAAILDRIQRFGVPPPLVQRG